MKAALNSPLSYKIVLDLGQGAREILATGLTEQEAREKLAEFVRQPSQKKGELKAILDDWKQDGESRSNQFGAGQNGFPDNYNRRNKDV